jgi:hypothetical protein
MDGTGRHRGLPVPAPTGTGTGTYRPLPESDRTGPAQDRPGYFYDVFDKNYQNIIPFWYDSTQHTLHIII